MYIISSSSILSVSSWRRRRWSFLLLLLFFLISKQSTTSAAWTTTATTTINNRHNSHLSSSSRKRATPLLLPALPSFAAATRRIRIRRIGRVDDGEEEELRWTTTRRNDLHRLLCSLSSTSTSFSSTISEVVEVEQDQTDTDTDTDPTTDTIISNDNKNCDNFYIRDGTYEELGQAADVIMDSFYGNSTGWTRQLYRMGELNRLQQGFPYSDTRHQHKMIVAVVDTTSDKNSLNSLKNKDRVIGFCDIDMRKPNRPTGYKYNPRPYLSDLCIAPEYRRSGVATSLIRRCEQLCLESSTKSLERKNNNDNDDDKGQRKIYIRVERTNTAAIHMYKRLGYGQQTVDDDSGNAIEDGNNKIILLSKMLQQLTS